jgi:hypothetical protein
MRSVNAIPQTDLPIEFNCRKSRFAGSTNNRNTISMTGVASSISLQNNNTYIQNFSTVKS